MNHELVEEWMWTHHKEQIIIDFSHSAMFLVELSCLRIMTSHCGELSGFGMCVTFHHNGVGCYGYL
jgi:hypothetical protein